jgi:hypothetical protein
MADQIAAAIAENCFDADLGSGTDTVLIHHSATISNDGQLDEDVVDIKPWRHSQLKDIFSPLPIEELFAHGPAPSTPQHDRQNAAHDQVMTLEDDFAAEFPPVATHQQVRNRILIRSQAIFIARHFWHFRWRLIFAATFF